MSEREEREMGSNCLRTAGWRNRWGEEGGIAEESAGLSADTLSGEKSGKLSRRQRRAQLETHHKD